MTTIQKPGKVIHSKAQVTTINGVKAAGTPAQQAQKIIAKRKKTKVTAKKTAPKKGQPVDPLKAQIDAALALRYGPQEQSLASRNAAINPWFSQLQTRLASQQAAQQGYYAGLQAQNVAAQQQAAQSPDLGPGVSPDVQAQAKLAGASRAALVGGFGQAIGAAGGAENAYLGNQSAVAGAAQLAQQQQTAQEQKNLAAEKGQYAVQYRGQLEDAQQKAALEQAALGLNVQKEADTVKIAQQKIKTTKRGQTLTAKQKAADRRAAARQKAADRKTRLTINQQNAQARKEAAAAKAQAQAQAAKSKAQAEHTKSSNKGIGRLNNVVRISHMQVRDKLPGGKTGPPRRPSPTETIAQAMKQGYSSDEIHLALTRVWGPSEIATAHRLGIKVSDVTGHVIKKKGTPKKKKVKVSTGQGVSGGGTSSANDAALVAGH